ncbi:Uncharacterised protein [Mycobacteroides abscessus subsp. abscessus]|uniref:hypothetical protein n=1 Tax=Mycobacteroides abscessus TaxID=36809 RepID=UPI00092C35F2|nr:hypothetical protein [Mycobacteroides abscessus]MDM2350143.1 hypothetical protein [Mycobacteroides abscessus]MDM2360585.1 hypothetical protein [Mycobacteroides abscessus]QSN52749.1 hypothetical protein I3U39_02955 [Mycobacteroides abscessus subsp. abscessus]QSN53129.1 hypothetical protein I3U39_05165 [Mycobacteroides abscessus subsp. abscessus]SHU07283.1 Uncharacterised protein [Mycobacteroides abscessus subsp. bolletii]
MPPPTYPGPEWLDAKTIAARTGGVREIGTVRSWWANKRKPLEYQVFEALSPRSNKRSHRDVVDRYLMAMGITPIDPPDERARSPFVDVGAQTVGHPRLDDVLDALASVKASADAALELLISDSESRTQAYKTLRAMLHQYDMAMTVLVRPHTVPQDMSGSAS